MYWRAEVAAWGSPSLIRRRLRGICSPSLKLMHMLSIKHTRSLSGSSDRVWVRKWGDNPSIYRIRALMSPNHGIMEWFELEETLKTVWFQPSCHGWGHTCTRADCSNSVLGFCTRPHPHPHCGPHKGALCTLHQHVQPEKQHKENSTHGNTNYSQVCCCSQVKMNCPKPVIFKMISSPHQVCPGYPAHLYSLWWIFYLQGN